MQAHPQVVGVQEQGCVALLNMCCGTDAAVAARKQRAVQAGGPGAATAAMQAHPDNAEVQQLAQSIIDHVRVDQAPGRGNQVIDLTD